MQRSAISRVRAMAIGSPLKTEKSAWWPRYGKWLERAFTDPDSVTADRRDHVELRLGEETYLPSEYAAINTRWVLEDKHRGWWPKLVFHLLAPRDPGLGIRDEDLGPLLDALEERATDGVLQRLWIDSFVILACIQQGMMEDADRGRLAHERLVTAAGGKAPAGTRRKPGVYWPIWRAQQASR